MRNLRLFFELHPRSRRDKNLTVTDSYVFVVPSLDFVCFNFRFRKTQGTDIVLDLTQSGEDILPTLRVCGPTSEFLLEFVLPSDKHASYHDDISPLPSPPVIPTPPCRLEFPLFFDC